MNGVASATRAPPPALTVPTPGSPATTRQRWLVQASHDPRNDAEAHEAELAMVALAKALDGEYDGNEVDLGGR